SPEKVSILAPVGSALLGLHVGAVIEWPVPGGRTIKLEVLSIRYQPESSGELHRSAGATAARPRVESTLPRAPRHTSTAPHDRFRTTRLPRLRTASPA